MHKPLDCETLVALAAAFGRKLVFVAHDHDAYCPRRHYYSPWGRKNCRRAWGTVRCACCTLPDALRSRRLPGTGEFGRRLERLRRLPAIVLSEFMRGRLLANGFAPERCHLIPPFIDLPVAAPRAAGEPGRVRLLFLGQLIRGTGTDLLLRVLSRLRTPFHAVVAGDGKDRAMMERLAAGAKWNGSCEFAGWHPSPESLFLEADIVVLPFRWQEPFGLVGLEAAAHGVPVVAFRVGGVDEWLRDGWNGVAVKPGDVAGMAAAVDDLAGRPEARSAMGRHGVELAGGKFSRARFLEHMERLIEAVR